MMRNETWRLLPIVATRFHVFSSACSTVRISLPQFPLATTTPLAYSVSGPLFFVSPGTLIVSKIVAGRSLAAAATNGSPAGLGCAHAPSSKSALAIAAFNCAMPAPERALTAIESPRCGISSTKSHLLNATMQRLDSKCKASSVFSTAVICRGQSGLAASTT